MSPVDELPVGTVTFLFTDIEGSTRLLKQLRDRYGEVLEEHQRILRETFAAHDGHEIDTQGDSFFVAFRRAKEAVAAAVDGQRRLAAHDWPDGTELRVRMGIHTGEPASAGQRYVGLGVHRAARISAAGHGGQVLVSQVTRELLRDDPLPDVSLRDLGEHQLKDLDEPERLYQLVAPGLEETFAPLKTAATAPFEGREGELAEAAAEQMAAGWRRPGRRRTLLLATFGAAVIGVVAGVLLTQGGGSTASAAPNSVGLINPSSGRIAATAPVGASPGGLASGAGAIWVANTDDNTVSRIEPSSNQVSQTIQVGRGPAGVAVGGGAVWVTNGLDGTVSRIDPSVNQEVKRIHVGNGPVGIAYGAKRVWVANSVDGTVAEIDPGRLRVKKTIPAVPGATGIVVAFGRVWVASPSEGVVVALDPGSGEVADRIGVGVDPIALAAGDGAIWVANRDDGTVSEIAPQPPAHVAASPVRVGHGPLSIAVVGGGVWVANGPDGTLMRIDASSGAVDKVVNLAYPPQALAGTGAGIYVAVRSSGLEHRGGTLRVQQVAPDFLDPALAYSAQAWTILSMTNDSLVGFRRVSGIGGVQLVPDLADALPRPSGDGRTYTFHPNYPAYQRTCLYGSGGNAGLARARRLVKSAGKAGTKVTVWMPADAAFEADFVVSLLTSIGLPAHVKALPSGVGPGTYFSTILDPKTRAQMGFNGWLADFPSDAGFLPPLYSCAAFSTSPERNSDPSEFCDPAVDRLFAKAEAAQAENPPAATALWQKAERAVLEQAPLVPTYNLERVWFLAKGVGNFQYHAQWQVLLDQLWLR